ncbi:MULTISPECIES: hypothetical protein [unclassified Clostridium]|uniref:hypothetical protein n=1 Tax=unclassified Clostridium TaxID=2614128 RepID=UPI0002982E55|nr:MULTISPECIES: hypothetical protein [unclassified Clostridium]EKQ54560.1 MAG: hypothetical protein A370_03151 [Clostridium sp. Maddingley MBC34-26]
MILSKKYNEEINKIVMTDDMKKRILQNVLAANENSEVKNREVEMTLPKVRKYNNLKRNMQMVAAGFTVILCLSIAKNYPMLIKNAPNDLEQNETVKDHDDENNGSKINDDNQFIYNKDGNEISNDDKENQTLNQNNNSDNHVKEENNTSSETGKKEKNKDKSQSNSGSEAVKSQTSQNNDDKSIGNSNIQSKTNPEQNSSNKENSNPTGTKPRTTDGDIMRNKISENNADNSVSSASAVGEKDVNYSQEYKTLDDAEKALNLKVNSLKNLPKGFKMESINVISNEIIQVDYNDGNSNIKFRAGKSIDNISGDYNAYEVKDTVKVNGVNVNLEGNKSEQYNLALWEKDGISYSISAENGIDEKTILGMIS